MNFKKANKNGFTLVELMVVVIIFGMIMACILNFIKPANEVHDDAQATMDANVISSGIIEYLDDELRYATNVLVLQDYMGVPTVSKEGLVGTKDTNTYTNCIMIDNVHFRGFATNSYSGKDDDTPAKRMGATGCIYKINKIDTEGFDFKNARVVKGEDFYDKFKYVIQVGTNIVADDDETLKASKLFDDSLKTLQFNMQTYFPVYKNGEYRFKRKFDRSSDGETEDEKTKNQGAVINLTNINITDEDSFDLSVIRCPDPTMPVAQVAAVMSGQGFAPVASAPTGVTESQKQYYTDLTKRYTYIFYQKNGNKADESSDCTVKFVTSESVKIDPSSTTVARGTVFKDFPKIPTLAGASHAYWVCDKDPVDTTKGYPIKKDTTFTLVYQKDSTSGGGSSTAKLYTVTWKGNANATVKAEDATSKVPENTYVTSYPTLTFDDTKWVLNPATNGWKNQLTGEAASAAVIKGDTVFEVDLLRLYKIKFKFSDSDIRDGTSVVSGQKAVNYGETPTPSDPSKEHFDHWETSDTHKDIKDAVITADTTFVPVFASNPASPLTCAGVSMKTDWNCIKYTITITNNSDSPVTNFTVALPCKESGATGFDFDADNNKLKSVSFSPTSYAKFRNNSEDEYNRFVIAAKSSITLKIKINCDAKPEGTQTSYNPPITFYHTPDKYNVSASDVVVTG